MIKEFLVAAGGPTTPSWTSVIFYLISLPLYFLIIHRIILVRRIEKTPVSKGLLVAVSFWFFMGIISATHALNHLKIIPDSLDSIIDDIGFFIRATSPIAAFILWRSLDGRDE
jgi:hypothetical protein